MQIIRMIWSVALVAAFANLNSCSRGNTNSRTEAVTLNTNNMDAEGADDGTLLLDPVDPQVPLALLPEQLEMLKAVLPDDFNIGLNDVLKEYMNLWYLLTAKENTPVNLLESFAWLVGSTKLLLQDNPSCLAPDVMLDWTAAHDQPVYMICRNPVQPLPASCKVSPRCISDDVVCLVGCSKAYEAFPPLTTAALNLDIAWKGPQPIRLPVVPVKPQPQPPGSQCIKNTPVSTSPIYTTITGYWRAEPSASCTYPTRGPTITSPRPFPKPARPFPSRYPIGYDQGNWGGQVPAIDTQAGVPNRALLFLQAQAALPPSNNNGNFVVPPGAVWKGGVSPGDGQGFLSVPAESMPGNTTGGNVSNNANAVPIVAPPPTSDACFIDGVAVPRAYGGHCPEPVPTNTPTSTSGYVPCVMFNGIMGWGDGKGNCVETHHNL